VGRLELPRRFLFFVSPRCTCLIVMRRRRAPLSPFRVFDLADIHFPLLPLPCCFFAAYAIVLLAKRSWGSICPTDSLCGLCCYFGAVSDVAASGEFYDIALSHHKWECGWPRRRPSPGP
jgi:hypothetical protein